jgi:hypothetical protein
MGRLWAVTSERRRYYESPERARRDCPFDAVAVSLRRRLARNRRLFVGSVVTLVGMFVVFLLLLTPSSASTTDVPFSAGAEDATDVSFRDLLETYVSASVLTVLSTDDR